MPALILSSRFSSDSQILRQAARERGWETFRLDGAELPDWFDHDGQLAMFYTAPQAFQIARQCSHRLLGCDPAWTINLPAEFLHRSMRQMTLEAALREPGSSFVKHAVSKAFRPGVYDAVELREVAIDLPRTSLVNVVEPVEWQVEYRAFVRHRQVATISPYLRNGRIIEHHHDWLDAPREELIAAQAFCQRVLESACVPCPPGFVLDVGIIRDRGWAVVEFNECWASGIYACEPTAVLETLLAACVSRETADAWDAWDFERHYFAACPSA